MSTTPIDSDKASSDRTVEDRNTGAAVQMTTARRLIIFVSMALALLLASLDLTIVTTAIPRISQEFNALSEASWIATAYILTSTALQPLFGRLSDTFGRTPTVIISVLIFVAGSAICGWAQSLPVLIFGRALQGIGGSGIEVLVFIVISDVTSEKQRPAYMGILGAVWTISSAIGPLLGGVFTDKVTWRWAFYINLPVAGAVLVAVVFFMRLPQPSGSFWSKLKKVDFLGSLVLIGAVVMLLLAMTWGGQTYSWSSPLVICMLVFSFVLFAVFLLVEWKVAVQPTVPIPLFRIRNVCLSVVGQFFMGVAMYTPIFFIPIWYTIVMNSDATAAGLHLLPYLVSMSVVSIVSGFLVSKTGQYRVLVNIGTAIFVVGCGLLITFDENISTSKQIAYLFLMGFGTGLNIQILMIVVQTAAPVKDMAASTTLFLFMRLLGASIGIAAMQCIFQNAAKPELMELSRGYPQFASIFPDSLNDQSLIYTSGLPNHVRQQLVAAYVEAIKKVFIANVCFATMGLIFSLPLSHVPLRYKK